MLAIMEGIEEDKLISYITHSLDSGPYSTNSNINRNGVINSVPIE